MTKEIFLRFLIGTRFPVEKFFKDRGKIQIIVIPIHSYVNVECTLECKNGNKFTARNNLKFYKSADKREPTNIWKIELKN